MGRAILVVWWIGLIGALIATVAILKQVALVLRALQDIHQLAQRTREAARGVATHLAAVAKLAAVEEPASGLRQATSALASTAASVEQKLDSLTRGTTGAPRHGE